MNKQEFEKKLDELGLEIEVAGPGIIGIVDAAGDPLGVIHLDAPLSMDTSFVDFDRLDAKTRDTLFDIMVAYSRTIEPGESDEARVSVQDPVTKGFLVKTEEGPRWVYSRHTQYDYKFTAEELSELGPIILLHAIKGA